MDCTGGLATGLSSLVMFLKRNGLRIRVGWAKMDGWELAHNQEQDIEGRKEMNIRGMVLRLELDEGGVAPMRVGQCWELGGRAYEILGFDGEDVEVMEWESKEGIKIGHDLWVSDKDVEEGVEGSNGRPTGMGVRNKLSKQAMMENSSHILELSKDTVTKGGEGRLLCRLIARKRKRMGLRISIPPDYLSREWALSGVEGITHIYTDGSLRKNRNWGEFLLGEERKEAGGAVILSDGKGWFYKIFVKIDLEISDAGQIELICLLIACEIARAEGRKIKIGTDCSSAIDVAEGAYS